MNGRPQAGDAPAIDAIAQELQAALAQWEAADRPVSLPDAGPTQCADEGLLPLLRTAQLLQRHRQVPSQAFRRQLADALVAEADRQGRERQARLDPGAWREAFGSQALRPRLQLALRAAAILLALGLGLGAFTVAQAARDPDGWAGRLIRATRELAEEALPGILPPTFSLPLAGPPTAAPAASPTPAPLGAAARPAIAPSAGADEGAPAPAAGPRPQPTVVLGRKPGRSGQAAAAGAGATQAEEEGSGQAPEVATPIAAAPTAPLADRNRATPSATVPLRPAASPSAAVRLRATGPAPSATPPPAPGPAGAAISGRVELSPGRPLKGIPVSAFRLDAKGQPRWWDPAATVRSDGEGRYRLEGLAPGSYKLMAGYLFPLAPRRWYPAATRWAEAEAILLGAGQTLEGLDLRFAEADAAPLFFWAWLER